MRKFCISTLLLSVAFLSIKAQHNNSKDAVTPNQHNGYEFVDLGLSVMWANCNIGAKKPEDFGYFFAWGETRYKSHYSWFTYRFGDWCEITKYCSQTICGKDGFVDNKNVLELSDDAANVAWGGDWRIPTIVEFKELMDNCDWKWYSDNGLYGYKITSRINGNSIFLPASGYCSDTKVYFIGSEGRYWSSSLSLDDSSSAYRLYFSSESVDCLNSYYDRCLGQTIRPVYKQTQ